MIRAEQNWPEEFAERYRRDGYWTGETFHEFFEKRVQAHPDRIAVISGDQRWSYSELYQRSITAASGFLKLGITPGQRVIVQLPNIAEFFSAVFGLFRIGAIPVFALPAHRRAEITHFSKAAEAVAYIIPAIHDGFDYRNLAAEVLPECSTIRHVIVIGDPGEYQSFDEIVNQGNTPGATTFPAISASDILLMQLSGGSTGLSKLIPRTHDDYIYSFRESAVICGQDEKSIYLGVLPIAHNFPMSSPGTFGTFYAGGTVVLSPSPLPDVAFPLIEKEKVTITGMVPPLLLIWLQAVTTSTHDLSSLQVLQVGGAKLTPEVARRVEPAFHCKLQQVFGMAEGLVNYTRLDDADETVIQTQGRPISPADEILIVDDEDRPVPSGHSGNLLTRGPYTIRGYHDAPEANSRAFTADGYYRTGDIVMQTPEGYLVVQGRATDQINRGGEKISPEEVEDHLLAHPNVFDASVIAIPDEYLGERTCAYVIVKGEKPKAVVLKSWIRSRGLAAYKVPDQIIFIESFPETGVGKISRKQLRAALRKQVEQKN